MAQWHRFGVAVGIAALVGCGSPTPDAGVSHPASAVPAAQEPSRQAPTQASFPGPSTQQAPKLGASITDNPRATPPTDDARAKTAASSSDIQAFDRQAEAERAQREARIIWAEVPVNSGITGQKPDEEVNEENVELDGDDEQERASAQEAWEQQLKQEATTPAQEERPGG